MPSKPCRRTDDVRNGTISMFPGWGCCRCKTYNGFQRATCKECDHPACYRLNSPTERLPYVSQDMSGRTVTAWTDPPPTARKPEKGN